MKSAKPLHIEDIPAINIAWTLTAGFLVMFVQTGFTRAKNVAHTTSMNLIIYGVGMLGYSICRSAFQMRIRAIPALGGRQ